MGLLDSAGLSYFYKNLKAILSNKINGDGVNLIKHLTQEEYDALTDAKKNNETIYIIDTNIISPPGGPYLKITGGNITGYIHTNSAIITNAPYGVAFEVPNGGLVVPSTDDRIYLIRSGDKIKLDGADQYHFSVYDPVENDDAANKKYVDDSINAAITSAIEEMY